MRFLFVACLIVLGSAHAGAADRPPPKEGDPDDLVRYIFEINGCVMTENQLLEAYLAAGYGIGGSNNAVISVSNRKDVEVLERNPFRYRYFGSDYCSF